MRNLLLFCGILMLGACTHPSPQKPLSAVLEQERIEVPKGRSGVAPSEIRVAVVPTMPSDYEGIPVGTTPEGCPTLGSDTPQITIHVFSDIQCPYCNQAHFKLVEWVRKHPRELQLVYHHFPLSFHQYANNYARQAVCAAEQGQFWPVLADLFRSGYRPMDLRTLAKRHQMQAQEFIRCTANQASQLTVDRDLAEGKRLNVRGTPSFFVDNLSLNYVDLENLLKAKLKE
ncbi:MAG: hypothetical protein CVU65_06630 [Deltaproteobacteria bacterium HGW-Deltaproteobacteria-22]|jgi:protein-disulfide isomerase|nr:MAG: hypothetical protein CVU65_06630 [Deltaproteobacteria bacterium HGW-Deltaproteobacteria-22]